MPNYLKTTVVAAALLAIAGAAFYFIRARETHDRPDAGSAAVVVSTPGLVSPQESAGAQVARGAAGRRDVVYSVLDAGGTLDASIATAVGPDGVITDPLAVALVEKASVVCSDDFDPQAAMGPGRQTDATRAWAVTRVVQLCEGFDPSKYKCAPQAPDLSKVLRESGEDAAASLSMETIRTAPDFTHLYTAGQVLLETGRFPIKQAIPDGADRYGMTELMTAWAHASTLVACQEAGGCGPNSLEVAAYCANAGCPAGSTMQQALSQELSASDYRAVSGFYGWMLRQRKG